MIYTLFMFVQYVMVALAYRLTPLMLGVLCFTMTLYIIILLNSRHSQFDEANESALAVFIWLGGLWSFVWRTGLIWVILQTQLFKLSAAVTHGLLDLMAYKSRQVYQKHRAEIVDTYTRMAKSTSNTINDENSDVDTVYTDMKKEANEEHPPVNANPDKMPIFKPDSMQKGNSGKNTPKIQSRRRRYRLDD